MESLIIFLYKDVRISKDNLTQLPEHGVLSNIPKVECEVENNDAESLHIKADSGPVEYDDNETVYNSNSEMGSFIPSNVSTKKRKTNY